MGAALYPLRLKDSPLSLPIIFLGLGFCLPLLIPNLPEFNPLKYGVSTEHLTELAVIISLTTAGLKIDRTEGWKRWNTTWRLLGITMPLCIAALALTGSWLMSLPLGAAVLLGAVLAPTDPVLASDVQVGPPGKRNEHEVRFSLTSEAGLNDALAFPFVNLALVLIVSGYKDEIMHWLTIDVFWKLFAGIVAGILVGYAAGKIVQGTKSVATGGFVALALTLMAYGAAEIINSYGFLAVFVAARTFRHTKEDEQYYRHLHDFSDQIEKMLMTLLMIILGASIAQGLLTGISWEAVGVAFIFVLVIRPVSGLIGLAGSKLSFYPDKAIISFFGIRGIGSMYYLAYGLNHSEIGETYGETLWSVTTLIIVISIIIHGTSVSYIMKHVEKSH